MKNCNNILLISGSGRNVGKTTFCCKIIEKFSDENRIISIKTSSHFHKVDDTSSQVVSITDNYQIIEELNTETDKDTSRFLRAGSSSSFLIMAKESFLMEAFKKIKSNCWFRKSFANY
jgi:uridine kinase